MSAGDSAQSNSRWTIAGFEHYMLADETQAHPMVFWLKASFLGPTSTSHLTTALAAAVKRHPLLQATLAGSIFGRAKNLYWEHRHLAPPTSIAMCLAPHSGCHTLQPLALTWHMNLGCGSLYGTTLSIAFGSWNSIMP